MNKTFDNSKLEYPIWKIIDFKWHMDNDFLPQLEDINESFEEL